MRHCSAHYHNILLDTYESKQKMWTLFLFFIVINIISAQNLPSYINTCSQKDPNIKQCFIKNGNEALPFILKGDKKLKIPSLTPLRIDKVTVEPSPNFRMGISNISIFGFENAVIKDADIQLDKNKFTVVISIPLLDLKGQYVTSGRVLILPIEGTGPCTIQTYNGIYTYSVEMEHYDQKGRDHIKIKNSDVLYEAEKIEYNFEDLFNGNKQLSEQMNKFINDNWKELHSELQPTIRVIIKEIAENIMTSVIANIPYDKTFTP